ncbi:alpha/beta fold hydrolase [Abyssisolibacter fermentans]|uniref:alpha/beta fold hydrolase n=1 Tax=Abyssisolibacter fermentans TaxID=1766203 RepID=UPI0008369F36|nr:alpha/beta hydrolase [Abyssisolibacter fermentans]
MVENMFIKHEKYREGAPYVILLHGLLGSYKCWDALSKHLEDKYTIINCRLFGHEGNYEIIDKNSMLIKEYAKILKTYLEDHNIDEVNVIGHSLGGLIGLQLAKTTDFVSKMILVNVATKQKAVKESYKLKLTRVIEKQPEAFIKSHLKKMFINRTLYKEYFNKLIINEEAYKNYVLDIINDDYSDFVTYINKKNVYVVLSGKIFAKRRRKINKILEKYGYNVLDSSHIKMFNNEGSFVMQENAEYFNDYIKKILEGS